MTVQQSVLLSSRKVHTGHEFFYDHSGALERPLTLSEMIQVKSTDMLPIRITSHLRLLIFRVSVHGGVIFFPSSFCYISLTHSLRTCFLCFSPIFMCYFWSENKRTSSVFVHCLLTSSAVAAIPGSIESNSVALNSVFFFHSFQYLIQVVEHNWDM